jgi:hypothetical protein
MMHCNLQGFLREPNDLLDKDFNKVKKITLIVGWREEDAGKLKNLLNQFSGRKMPICYHPDGKRVTIRVSSINGKLGNKMLKLMEDEGRASWKNQMFEVRLSIKRYSFKSSRGKNVGQTVDGCNFLLESIDIV